MAMNGLSSKLKDPFIEVRLKQVVLPKMTTVIAVDAFCRTSMDVIILMAGELNYGRGSCFLDAYPALSYVICVEME